MHQRHRRDSVRVLDVIGTLLLQGDHPRDANFRKFRLKCGQPGRVSISYKKSADWKICMLTFDLCDLSRYTSTCTPLEKVTPLPDHDFARVFCTSTSWPYLGEVVYREFVAIPKARKAESLAKVAYWATRRDLTRPLPPSVVMLGIDSLSRMNYHRSFNLTKTFLDGIGAVEMMGYTKGGKIRGYLCRLQLQNCDGISFN